MFVIHTDLADILFVIAVIVWLILIYKNRK